MQNDAELGQHPTRTPKIHTFVILLRVYYLGLTYPRTLEKAYYANHCRTYPPKQQACAYNEHASSSVNMAMSMFKLSITSSWALMAARGWARLILDRRRDLINDRPNRATAAKAPLDEAQEGCHFDDPTAHTSGAYQHSKTA